MKRQKLLKNLNSKGRLLALLLTVTAGLLFSSSAWAWSDPTRALFDVKVWDGTVDKIYYIDKWKSNDSDAFSCQGYPGKDSDNGSFNGANLGTLSSGSLYIKGWCWANNQNQSYSSGNWRYTIDGGTPHDLGMEKKDSYSSPGWCDGHWWDRYDSGELTISYSSYSAGNHTLKCFFQAPWSPDIWINNGDKGYAATFTIAGVTMSSTSHNFEGVAVGDSKDQSFTATLYGTSNSIKSVSSSNTTDFGVSKSGTTVTVTFHPQTTGDKSTTITVTPTTGKSATISVTGTGNNTPTVLIAGKESVDAPNVTLNGYIKYTGCETVSSYGFVYGLDEGGEPTYDQQAVAGTSDVPAGTDFSTTFAVQESGTYNYRAYMTTSGGTYYSEERRQFTVDIACDITTTVNATFEDGSTTASATFKDGSASIGVKSTNHSQYFQWVCVSNPDGANATFEPQGKRTSTITVNMVGQYEIKLQGKCNESDNWIDSEILTLNVCAPAEFTQLYLDNHENNVLCVGEEATATCITKEGYTYALYSPAGTRVGEPLAGTGATQTWRHVEGAGVFTMRTSPTSMPYCAAVVSSATQSYNEPTLEIIADTDLANITNYQPVILSKKNVTSDTYVDTNPTWEIIAGSDKGYLLNEHNRLAYDSRAREKVVFKGGADPETTITIQASAYKTVAVEDEGGNYTKQCPTTVVVELTVKPATENCPD